MGLKVVFYFLGEFRDFLYLGSKSEVWLGKFLFNLYIMVTDGDVVLGRSFFLVI